MAAVNRGELTSIVPDPDPLNIDSLLIGANHDSPNSPMVKT